MSIIETVKKKLVGKNLSVIFPEGTDERILYAASRLKEDGILRPVLVGVGSSVKKAAEKGNFDIEGIEILDPYEYEGHDELVETFVQLRKGKTTRDLASNAMHDVNYFGTMLVYLDKVDAMVSGATHPTGDTVRPALQIVKTKPGVSRTSGAFIMVGPEGQKYIFADCAINIELTEQQLAEIAVESAKTASLFDIDPKVAMLSFSTYASADADEPKKIARATALAREMDPNLLIDGEMQFDAAISPIVGKRKAPYSKVAGEANVFIFPNISAGNIGYKIAQRLGNYQAIGPILQGLNKPISDLSRGCNRESVYQLAYITASQKLL